ncbi:GNAT family N-acetyltransferase [Clostridium sp. SM-530-WT-3G]|uniref:GNAT family N-acetyltransferase n=1 Tax=Clostridium sp. SM-530-WT-3G TaxID=2725303 RepID=UPI00145F2533|nr:GNAT family N-acetyltransferase [Clostridium sp. SM-530-WT-3G]
MLINYVGKSKSVIKDWIGNYSRKDYYQWAIILKENSSEPIGSIGVNTCDNTISMAHIGYCLSSQWWHKRIMFEALQCVIDFLFEEVGMNRLESRHDPRNSHSGEVMKKCGMKYEGTLRSADYNNQGICDASYYGILASER